MGGVGGLRPTTERIAPRTPHRDLALIHHHLSRGSRDCLPVRCTCLPAGRRRQAFVRSSLRRMAQYALGVAPWRLASTTLLVISPRQADPSRAISKRFVRSGRGFGLARGVDSLVSLW